MLLLTKGVLTGLYFLVPDAHSVNITLCIMCIPFKCTKQTLKLKGKGAFYILFFFFYVCIFSLIVSTNVSIKGSLTLFSVSRVVLSTYLHFGLLVFAYLSFIMMSRESLP